ncbi:OmpP1/FadL family transporter [candidate division KSB1 bacterium]
MRSTFRRLLVITLCVLMCTGTVFASGFSIFEQGARAMGMSGAFAARANDLSAIFHNPAGLANLYGTHVQFGTSLIGVGPEFVQAGTLIQANAVDQTFFPSTVYIGTRFNDRIVVAFGFYTPFGLGMKWNNDWIGKHIIKEINLQTFNLNPVIAYEVTDQLNVGVGFQYMHAKADISRYAAFLIPDATIEGDANGFGFNAGIQYEANEKVTFGFVYRSEIELNVEGDATFTYAFNDPTSLAVMRSQYPNSKAKLDITLPAMMFFGINYRPTDKLSTEFDINWTGWSSYKELAIKFDDPLLDDSISPKNWNNVYNYRFGLEYYYSDTWTLRCGGYFDDSPVDDEYLEPILPDSDRNGLTFGLGWSQGNMFVDAAYLHIFANDRATTTSIVGFNGSYKNSSDLFGVTFGYRLN